MLVRTFKLRLVGLFEPNSNARRGGHQLSIHTLGGKHTDALSAGQLDSLFFYTIFFYFGNSKAFVSWTRAVGPEQPAGAFIINCNCRWKINLVALQWRFIVGWAIVRVGKSILYSFPVPLRCLVVFCFVSPIADAHKCIFYAAKSAIKWLEGCVERG